MNRHRIAAVQLMEKLRYHLGEKCAMCGTSRQLEFDCIIPQGDKHHRWETNRRAYFYKRQHEAGNLQLLCNDCHKIKTRKDRVWLDNQELSIKTSSPSPVGSVAEAPF